MYLDAKFIGKKKRYQRLLEKNKLVRPVYCITLPVHGENIMEIYSSGELWFQYYRERELSVIGLAASRKKAVKLASQICLDIVQMGGDISPELMQKYFFGR